jgi:hypothetical protein
MGRPGFHYRFQWYSASDLSWASQVMMVGEASTTSVRTLKETHHPWPRGVGNCMRCALVEGGGSNLGFGVKIKRSTHGWNHCHQGIMRQSLQGLTYELCTSRHIYLYGVTCNLMELLFWLPGMALPDFEIINTPCVPKYKAHFILQGHWSMTLTTYIYQNIWTVNI